MRTRICLSLVLGVGLLTLGVRGDPADGPAADSSGTRARRRAADLVEQRARRSDSTVREAGVLQSADVLEIRSEVEGLTSALHVVPYGNAVKKGDLLVEHGNQDGEVLGSGLDILGIDIVGQGKRNALGRGVRFAQESIVRYGE